MAFDRWTPIFGQTFAYQLFRRSQTHLNALFWAHFVAKRHAFASTKGHTPEDAVSVVFTATGENPRFNWELGEWAENYEDFDRWSRMAVILAVAGYLETFLAQIATAALQSCPALLIGGAKELDGVVQLKQQPNYSFFEHAEGITRGDWNSRAFQYKTFFKNCPFENEVKHLEKLRILRNNTGHSFGRNIATMQFPERSLLTRLTAIPDQTIFDYLAMTERVATGVENHLSEYVGSYEVIRAYHVWKKEAGPKGFIGAIGKQFSTYIAGITGSPMGKNAAMSLISYYNKV